MVLRAQLWARKNETGVHAVRSQVSSRVFLLHHLKAATTACQAASTTITMGHKEAITKIAAMMLISVSIT